MGAEEAAPGVNDQTYKTCPRCHHRTIVQMPRCQRCGYDWRQEPGPPAATGRGGSARQSPWLPVLAFLAAGAVLFAVVSLSRRQTERPSSVVVSVPAPVLPVSSGALPAPPVTAAPPVARGTAGLPVTSAPTPEPGARLPEVTRAPAPPAGPLFFRERPGARRTPTLRIANESRTTLTVDLVARDGLHVTIVVPAYRDASREVAPGSYQLAVWCDDPSVLPARGDATFLRFKEYEGSFCIGSADEQRPVHLGD